MLFCGLLFCRFGSETLLVSNGRKDDYSTARKGVLLGQVKQENWVLYSDMYGAWRWEIARPLLWGIVCRICSVLYCLGIYQVSILIRKHEPNIGLCFEKSRVLWFYCQLHFTESQKINWRCFKGHKNLDSTLSSSRSIYSLLLKYMYFCRWKFIFGLSLHWLKSQITWFHYTV